MKSALLVLSVLSLSACVGTGIDTAAQDVNLSKDGTVSACPGLTGVSAQYSRSVAGMPFRCGPQSQSPVSYQ